MLQQASRARSMASPDAQHIPVLFARNYRVVDFLLNRETGGGRYLLEKR